MTVVHSMDCNTYLATDAETIQSGSHITIIQFDKDSGVIDNVSLQRCVIYKDGSTILNFILLLMTNSDIIILAIKLATVL